MLMLPFKMHNCFDVFKFISFLWHILLFQNQVHVFSFSLVDGVILHYSQYFVLSYLKPRTLEVLS